MHISTVNVIIKQAPEMSQDIKMNWHSKVGLQTKGDSNKFVRSSTNQHLYSLTGGPQRVHFAHLKRDTFAFFEKKTITAGRNEKGEQLLCLAWRLPLQTRRSHQPVARKNINLWLQITQLLVPHIQRSTAHTPHGSSLELLGPRCMGLMGKVSGVPLNGTNNWF